MDLQVITEALVVVVIGGLGSVPGTFLAAIIVSELNAFGILVFPEDLDRPRLSRHGDGADRAALGTARARRGGRASGERRWSFRAGARSARDGRLLVVLGLGGRGASAARRRQLSPRRRDGSAHLHALCGEPAFSARRAAVSSPSATPPISASALMARRSRSRRSGCGMETAIPAGILLGLAGALVFGWFCVRLSGVYFAMLTLAFAQIAWSIAYQWTDVTGGDNGIIGVWPSAWAASPARFYWLTLALSAGGVALLRVITFSPFGYALRALRDSTLRAETIGIERRRVQWMGFVIAGAFAALAGALYAFLKGSVFPDNISAFRCRSTGWSMVLLGGVGTVSGGVVGAAIYRSLSIWVISHTDYSKLVLGALIILLVVLFPKGLVGAFEAWRSARTPARLHGRNAMSILVVEDLGKSYSGFQAVRDVSFALEAGEMLALIGPNGAGKSTCFNMIDGQLAPTSGRIAIFGRSTAGMTPGDIWRLGVGRTFQVAATFASMTVAENVQMALLSHHPRRWPALRWAARYHAAEAERPARSRRHGRPGATQLRRARLRRSQAARARHRARQRSEAAADGRAGGRHGAARAPRADGPHWRASPANARSASSSPSTTWTWCSVTPTACSCSIAGR